MDFVELYYNLVWGCYPFDTNENKIKSQKVIDYLIETKISEADMLSLVENAAREDCLTPQMLPDFLWEGSLLQRDRFYYHSVLHLTSKAPTWDPVLNKRESTPFYLEMKIRFSMEDLLTYYYNLFSVEYGLRDVKKDSGSFNYLLNRFSKFSFIEPVDFTLSLMDYAKSQSDNYTVKNVLDISTFESDVYKLLKDRVAEAELAKANRIVWR
jgi:hypothetical protein